MVGEPIKVENLAAVNKALRKVSADAPKGLRVANNAAADLLVAKMIPKIPRRTGAAAKSVRASSTRTSARVAMGGPRAPYVPWLDFGGHTGIRGSVRRPFYTDGRYLFPTLKENRAAVETKLGDALRDVIVGAGLDVT